MDRWDDARIKQWTAEWVNGWRVGGMEGSKERCDQACGWGVVEVAWEGGIDGWRCGRTGGLDGWMNGETKWMTAWHEENIFSCFELTRCSRQ
jgi:hypothetical protein